MYPIERGFNCPIHPPICAQNIASRQIRQSVLGIKTDYRVLHIVSKLIPSCMS